MKHLEGKESPLYKYDPITHTYSFRNNGNKKKNTGWCWAIIIIVAVAVIIACIYKLKYANNEPFDLSNIPEYSGVPYCELNDNIPSFETNDYSKQPFVHYSELDSLGRCGVAYAKLSIEMMPSEERKQINSIVPSGWQNDKYSFIDQEYLYNRCHLIAFMLAGENANEKNLITGTRYLNIEGMLPFETRVARYIELTKNHVLYRITPIYKGNNLVASGIQMEAWSIEDNGENICFNVFIYNVQPGVVIDYSTGDSRSL